jgi:hypothetical protein
MAGCRIVLLLISVLLSATAYALPLSYDESVDGDLDGNNMLPLDVGTNSIIGTLCDGFLDCGQDFDTFLFLLPPDGALTQISLAFTLDNWGASIPGAAYVILPFTVGESVSFLLDPSPALLFATYIPILSVDPVRFSHTTLSCGCLDDDGWFASYELQMEVTASTDVPTPGTFGLLLLAGTALWRHRQWAAEFAK